MDDAAYVGELYDNLVAPYPIGIDPRTPENHAAGWTTWHLGFGRDVWVTSVTPVSEGHHTHLEVGYTMVLDGEPLDGSARAPLEDHRARARQGYADPAKYAPHVAARVLEAARDLLVAERASGRRARDPGVPDRDAQWRLLIDGLGGARHVRQAASDRLEVSLDWTDEPARLTVLVTPEQWERVVVRHRVDLAPHDFFAALLGPLQEDERFVVFFRDDLTRSTRAELPPVRGTTAQRRMEALVAAARAENPDATFGWHAERPGKQPDDR